MRKVISFALLLMMIRALCPGGQPDAGRQSIPFAEGQLYAAAYLGYQQADGLGQDLERYLGGETPASFRISDGEYYLIIPRYDGMELALYRRDLETMELVLLHEDPDCGPFLLQCNASDIFADACVRLTWQGETVEFTPYISLKDGSVQIGSRGLDLTAP